MTGTEKSISDKQSFRVKMGIGSPLCNKLWNSFRIRNTWTFSSTVDNIIKRCWKSQSVKDKARNRYWMLVIFRLSGDTALKTQTVLSWKSLLGLRNTSNNQRLQAQLTASSSNAALSCQDVAKCEQDSDASLGQSSFKMDKVENICGQINQNWKFVLGNMDATSCSQSAVLLLSRWRLSGEASNISANNDELIKQHGFTLESRYWTDLVMDWMSYYVTDVKAEITHFLHLKWSTLLHCAAQPGELSSYAASW